MLCLVQSFQQAKLEAKAKTSKPRKVSFFRRKKHAYAASEHQDENLLHPNSGLEPSGSFWRREKQLKKLSGSAPSMTCTSLDNPCLLTPTTCRSRQKKFLRHFTVEPDEKVIDYYSCALVADILLQGHLYISKNYFAFYSNVFGYVTKLLIPTASVVSLTKEKTAYILPNAVGVTTTEDRHVFSSLLSRDTTYRLMVQVWRSAVSSPTPLQHCVLEREGDVCEESSSLSGSESVFELKPSPSTLSGVPTSSQVHTQSKSLPVEPVPCAKPSSSLSRSTLLLVICTALLVALFLSAAVLMYRLSQLQHSIASQAQGSRSLYEVQEFLDLNLNNLYKVRKSLETLSLLIESEKEKLDWREGKNNQGENQKQSDRILLTTNLEEPSEDVTS